MKYKIIIRKCEDVNFALEIAKGIARWSGSSIDIILKVITEKSVCIKREADESEALQIKARFEAYGAEVELVPLPSVEKLTCQSIATAKVNACIPPQTKHCNDGEEDDDEGRILTDAEFVEVMRQRADIFQLENNASARNFQVVTLVVVLGLGFWTTKMTFASVATDFYEKIPDVRPAIFMTSITRPPIPERSQVDRVKEKEIKTDDKKSQKQTNSSGASVSSNGGGDPKSRITAKGVLGIISGAVKGKTVASADIFGKGGFAAGIDAVISGVGGLKSGGDGGTGRADVASIGYGLGYGPGFGGSGGGVDDLIRGLIGNGNSSSIDIVKKGTLTISPQVVIDGASLTGGRSKAGIMRVVMQNISALRYAYSKRLKDKPGLKGVITVRFAIDDFGKVIHCSIVKSDMDDSELEESVRDRISRWAFEKIDKAGDVTEVTYPFAFSQ
jgi:TonB family protein